MTTTCDDCIYAEWRRTKAGRLHPSKEGKCTRLIKHPLDMRIPAAFYWGGWDNVPTPSGGYIERGQKINKECVFKTGAP